jgi:hypothetical protein
MPNFHIDQRLIAQKDIIRNYSFELLFPNIDKVCPSIKNPDDLLVRCKSAIFPSRGNEIIESWFMGLKQIFPSKPRFGNVLSTVIEESSDQKIMIALNEWNNWLFQVDPNGANAGASQANVKRLSQGSKAYAIDAFLTTYSYDGVALAKKIKFFNCFPTNVGDVPLEYAGNDSVKFSTDFSFDFWTFI